MYTMHAVCISVKGLVHAQYYSSQYQCADLSYLYLLCTVCGVVCVGQEALS